MPIPEFVDGEYGVLPVGDHEATLEEVRDRFTSSFARRELFKALERIVLTLWDLGVAEICLDGSFVTDKRRPNDVDIWFKAPNGADSKSWPSPVSTTKVNRDRLKKHEGVDLCWHPMQGSLLDATALPDFWRTKNGVAKGLVWLQKEDVT